MKSRPVLAVLSLFLLASLSARSSPAEAVVQYKDEAAESKAYNTKRVVKTVEGLNFEVEEDRPIVQVGGIYRPVDIDAYVAIKFSELDQRLRQETQRLEDRIDELDERVKQLEARGEAPGQEEAAEPAASK